MIIIMPFAIAMTNALKRDLNKRSNDIANLLIALIRLSEVLVDVAIRTQIPLDSLFALETTRQIHSTRA